MLIIFNLSAQDRCSSAAYQDKIRKQYPELNIKLASLDKKIKNLQEQLSTSSAMMRTLYPWDTVFVPVVVHVVYSSNAENISDDQIRSQIEVLNADFNKKNSDFAKVPSAFGNLAGDARIYFVLATADPEGRPTNGIVRKKSGRMLWTDDDLIKYDGHGGSTAWDTKSYLNIWIGNLTGGLLGYASFPGGPAEKDGVVIRPNVFGSRGRFAAGYDKGRTATHEIGHWLNLKHLWGDVNCGDDDIFDTPRQRSHNTGCPSFPRVNSGCDNGVNGDMFMNYMDFTNDACMGMFTLGQTSTMRAMFEQGMPHNDILNSKGLQTPWNMVATPVNSEGFSGKMKIYPNPSSQSTITIESPESVHWIGESYSIYNQSGQMILSGKLNQARQSVNISRLASGIYHIRVGNQLENLSGKFVKQ